MSRSQYPTANSILQAAAKHGVAVRINFGTDGRIASLEMIGRVGELAVVPGDGAAMNPWDDVLENQKRPS
jgi:hypothetical protein